MNASFSSCFVTLLKTTIGSGALSFPYLFKTYGILTSVLLTLVSGLFAVVGLVLYVKSAKEIGRDATLSELSTVSMPYTKTLVDFSVFLKCFGVSLSYVIITRQLLPLVVHTSVLRSSTLLLLFIILVGPFCYFNKLHKLRHTSMCGIVSILFVILATVYRYKHTVISNGVVYTTPFKKSYLSGFGKFVFSFTCHQNIFAVHSEMIDNSYKSMKTLIYSVALTSMSLYITFGYFNYLIYGEYTNSNIITNYPNDILATTVRGLYIIVMGVSYPLQVMPCRVYLMKMIPYTFKGRSHHIVSTICTTTIIILTYCISISGIDLGLVYSIIGATASTFICLIFPVLVYFNMDIDRTVVLDVLGYLSFLFGIFVFLSTILGVVLKG